ncbi:probable receptor-like protein kinase At5g24010 [Quercus suber]|uniref:probable receptor-like protein kinase At5g24010 n=1 Tax=Quercus suber TaxID=58331 RepID=UPI000CE27227|nr:probable receptor-like protein kinase At5g24010 [Quercus suber]POF02820.1 putative receptor-like protein kinase [Quercus suber]
MEKLQFHKIHLPPFAALLFLLQFLSVAYSLTDNYFINCGSATNANTDFRNFVGDLNSSDSISSSFSFTGHSSAVTNSNQSSGTSSTLYQTARIFRSNSSYEFDIPNNDIYFVRLHFFAFSTPTDLSTALFDVWTSGSSLLLNFTGKNSSNFPIKEFFLPISPGKFNVYFLPRGSSFAFINAIEVFPANDSYIPDEAKQISSAGSNNTYRGLRSWALQTIYRINVGGPKITPENDTLWRNWVSEEDDIYFDKSGNATTVSHPSEPNYEGNVRESISESTAPTLVYQTAAKPKDTSGDFNLTWSFNVDKSAGYLVRVHFCDIISESANILNFSLHVYNNFSMLIDPYEYGGDQLAVPFYIDFVVYSGDSGHLNIRIGPSVDTSIILNSAFLNGLEIMKILGNSGITLRLQEHKKKNVFIIIGSILGGLGLICILVAVFFLVFRCRKPKSIETSDWSPLPGGGSSHSRMTEGTIPNMNLGLKMPFSEIQLATKNFDVKLRIGKGGFGIVYKGTLKNGTKIAVKRSDPGSGQGLPEFQTEIMVLSKIRHRHLVSLIGYCDERSEMILVYEFMANGTLRDHLYASDKPPLSWKQRLEICIGAARGLHYLHKGSAGGIIHRDVKPTNILLDKSNVAKVADFGLSKSGPLDDTHVSTTVKGTIGYLDPEYFKSQQLTEKSDVYSFGVVLLEVLCARPAIDSTLPREQANLAEWAMLCKNKGLLEDIIDPSLKDQIDPNSLRKFIETTEKCLQECGTDRPTMGDILWDLEYALQLQQTAMPREPHEDSTIGGSAALAMPNVWRFPSISMSIEKDDMPAIMDDGSYTRDSEVFSQLKADASR